MLINFLFLLFLLLPLSAQAATFYVATNGNNNNSGSEGSPWQTIQFGIDQLSPGDTLRLRGGTYTDNFGIDNINGGSWSTPITIEAFPGETVIYQSPGDCDAQVQVRKSQYVIVRGFTIDGSSGCNTLVSAGYTTIPVQGSMRLVSIDCLGGTAPGNCSNNLLFEDMVFRNSAGNGFGINCEICNDVTVRNSEYYNIGKVEGSTPNYSAAPRTTFEGNYFHDITGTAISFWNEGNFVVDGVIARNNRMERIGYFWAPTNQNGDCWNCSTGGGCATGCGNPIPQGNFNRYIPAIFLSRSSAGGEGGQIYNNIISDSAAGIIVSHGARRCKVYNNTIYLTDPQGSIDPPEHGGILAKSNGGGVADCLFRNNIVHTPGVTSPAPIQDLNGSANVWQNNMCSAGALAGLCFPNDPLFASQATGDFRLLAGSPAIGAGTNSTLSVAPTDYNGVPHNDPPDLGALAFDEGATPNTYLISRNLATVQAGQNITASWITDPGPAQIRDWICLTLANLTCENLIGQDGAGGSAWIYIGGSTSPTTAPLTGNFTLAAPLMEGTYKFWYCLNDSTTNCPAQSETFQVTTPPTATGYVVVSAAWEYADKPVDNLFINGPDGIARVRPGGKLRYVVSIARIPQ